MSTADIAYDEPECRGLLLDCCQVPSDDGPRLVLADWLEDAGQAGHAEYIRFQCEAVARKRSVNGGLIDMFTELRFLHSPILDIYRHFLMRLGLGMDYVSIERGLASEVTFQSLAHFRISQAVFRACPLTRACLLLAVPGAFSSATPSDDTLRWWRKADGDVLPRACDLPPDIFAGLDAYDNPVDAFAHYHSELEAQDDLSRALVRVGRARAALPLPVFPSAR